MPNNFPCYLSLSDQIPELHCNTNNYLQLIRVFIDAASPGIGVELE